MFVRIEYFDYGRKKFAYLFTGLNELTAKSRAAHSSWRFYEWRVDLIAAKSREELNLAGAALRRLLKLLASHDSFSRLRFAVAPYRRTGMTTVAIWQIYFPQLAIHNYGYLRPFWEYCQYYRNVISGWRQTFSFHLSTRHRLDFIKTVFLCILLYATDRRLFPVVQC